MKVENLIHVFDREIEVLEIKEDCMVYAIDRKDDTKNRCVIERYTFEDKKITSLLSLDYTRLYEAFQTYGQNPAFFYAVNVLDDYRVRLRRIDKNSWEIKEDILLNAEGEVLSLYILDENHLLVTDEAEANESYLRDWGMSDGSRYMELCYIYDIKTGKKYPVMDCRFHNLLETVKTYPITDGSRTMFIPQSNEVLAVNTGAWIDAVKSQKSMPFETVFKAGQDEKVAFVEDGALGFYGRVRGEGTEKIMFFGADGSCGPKCAYAYEAGGEYFYHPSDGHIYYIDGRIDENGRKHLACMMDSMLSLNISEDYGDFTGICTDEAYVTAFYKEVQVKEDTEFRECVAIHYRDGRTPEVFAGRCEYGGGRIILLKSYLAL